MIKYDFFSWVIGIGSILVALIWPDSKATMMVFAEYGFCCLLMIFLLIKNRKSIKLWQGAAVMAVYAVPSVLLLIQRGGNIPMNSIIGRIMIGMVAILMLVSAIYKIASQEEAA